jgi:hypothetical protein
VPGFGKALRVQGPLRGSGAAAPGWALRAIDSSARSRSWRTCGPPSLSWSPRGVVRGTEAVGPQGRKGRWLALVGLGRQMHCRAIVAAADPVGGCGRSHNDVWVGCIVWSTTASSGGQGVQIDLLVQPGAEDGDYLGGPAPTTSPCPPPVRRWSRSMTGHCFLGAAVCWLWERAVAGPWIWACSGAYQRRRSHRRPSRSNSHTQPGSHHQLQW